MLRGFLDTSIHKQVYANVMFSVTHQILVRLPSLVQRRHHARNCCEGCRTTVCGHGKRCSSTLGDSGARVFIARYISLSALNASTARKCCSSRRPTSTQWVTAIVSTPNASVTKTYHPDDVTSALVRGTFPQLAAVAEEHVRLRRVVRLHDHVLRTAAAPFTMRMCAPSSGSRCPTPSLLSCG